MPKTLLLADDSVTIQKVVGISFANEDVTLVTVDNGDDAITKAREIRPDLILADVVMPGKNGYEVCEAIKADPELAGTPVLLLTGTFETFDEARAEGAGADGHITKPFEAQALVDRVNALLAASSARPAAPAPEPDPLGLTGSVSPAEAAEQAYDLFEDEVTAPSGVAQTETPPTTVLIGGEPLVSDAQNAAAQTWSDTFDEPPSLAASTPPDLDADPVVASGVPLGDAAERGAGSQGEGAPLFGEDSPSSDHTQAFVLGDEDDGLALGNSAADPISDLFGDTDDVDATHLVGISGATSAGPEPGLGSEPGLRSEPGLDPESAGSPDLGGSPADEAPRAAPDLLADDADPILAELETGAAATALDPGAARAYDVSASELTVSAPVESEQTEPALTPPAPVALHSEPSWPAEPEAAGSQEGSTPSLLVLDDPLDDLPPAAPASSDLAGETAATAPPGLSPMLEQRLHESLEKMAWDAFGDLAERIVKDAVERIERVAWEVIPKMAETLVREEIRKLKDGEE